MKADRLAIRELIDAYAHCAETLCRQALTLAERQGALTCRLRAANSLSGLWITQGCAFDAEAVLAPVFNQLKPGLQQLDLRLAAWRPSSPFRCGASDQIRMQRSKMSPRK